MVSTFAPFAFSLPYYVAVLAVLFLQGTEHWAWSLSFLGIVLIRSVTDKLALDARENKIRLSLKGPI